MRIIKKEKIKGFTLLELMIFIGVASILSVASYMLYSVASNDKKFDTEYKNLSMVLKEVNEVTSTSGIPAGTNKSTLSKISGGLDTNLSMYDVNSPNPQRLNFVYKDVDSKTCNRFTSNMVNSAEYVTAVVNGTSVVNRENISNVVGKCGLEKNDVTIVYNKYIDTQVIASITPDINPVGNGNPIINDKPYVAPPTISVPFTPIVTPPMPQIIVGSIINTPTYVGDPGNPILNPIINPVPAVIPTTPVPSNPATPGGPNDNTGQTGALSRRIPYFAATGSGYADSQNILGYYNIIRKEDGTIVFGLYEPSVQNPGPAPVPQGGYEFVCNSSAPICPNYSSGAKWTLQQFGAMIQVWGLFNSTGSGGA